MNEKKYPIYNVTSKWKESSISVSIMFKHHLSYIQKKLLISDFEKGLRQKNDISSHITTTVRFLEFESWCLTRFNHYTFNEHYTDNEILESFERFVQRKMPGQEALSKSIRNRNLPNQPDENPDDFYCLMGAEDRFRWNICRCEKCRTRHVVTLDH